MSALDRARGFKFHAARPFNDEFRVSADVARVRSQLVRSIAKPALDRTA